MAHIQALRFAPDADLMAALDRGEREAIQLATEQGADLLIMDEWKGRAIVQRRRLPLMVAEAGSASKRLTRQTLTG